MYALTPEIWARPIQKNKYWSIRQCTNHAPICFLGNKNLLLHTLPMSTVKMPANKIYAPVSDVAMEKDHIRFLRRERHCSTKTTNHGKQSHNQVFLQYISCILHNFSPFPFFHPQKPMSLSKQISSAISPFMAHFENKRPSANKNI